MKRPGDLRGEAVGDGLQEWAASHLRFAGTVQAHRHAFPVLCGGQQMKVIMVADSQVSTRPHQFCNRKK